MARVGMAYDHRSSEVVARAGCGGGRDGDTVKYIELGLIISINYNTRQQHSC